MAAIACAALIEQGVPAFNRATAERWTAIKTS